jgi:hypothetical protein
VTTSAARDDDVAVRGRQSLETERERFDDD